MLLMLFDIVMKNSLSSTNLVTFIFLSFLFIKSKNKQIYQPFMQIEHEFMLKKIWKTQRVVKILNYFYVKKIVATVVNKK